MREKIALRELPSVLASFRKADSDLSGLIDKKRFRTLLRQDYGVGDIEDKVRGEGVLSNVGYNNGIVVYH